MVEAYENQQLVVVGGVVVIHVVKLACLPSHAVVVVAGHVGSLVVVVLPVAVVVEPLVAELVPHKFVGMVLVQQRYRYQQQLVVP